MFPLSGFSGESAAGCSTSRGLMKLMVPTLHPNCRMSSCCLFVTGTNILSTVEFSLKIMMFLCIIAMNAKWMSASASLSLARSILPKCTAAFCHKNRQPPGFVENDRCIVLFLLPAWTPCLWINLIVFIFVLEQTAEEIKVNLRKAAHLMQAPEVQKETWNDGNPG